MKKIIDSFAIKSSVALVLATILVLSSCATTTNRNVASEEDTVEVNSPATNRNKIVSELNNAQIIHLRNICKYLAQQRVFNTIAGCQSEFKTEDIKSIKALRNNPNIHIAQGDLIIAFDDKGSSYYRLNFKVEVSVSSGLITGSSYNLQLDSGD